MKAIYVVVRYVIAVSLRIVANCGDSTTYPISLFQIGFVTCG